MANHLPFIAIILAAAIILSGAHAKDIAALPGDGQKALTHDEQPVNKAMADVHTHIDKGGKTFKAMNDTLQADNRSLRLRAKKQSLRLRLPIFNSLTFNLS